MRKKTVSGIVLMLLLTSMLSSTFIIQPVKAAGETVYIRADESIDQPVTEWNKTYGGTTGDIPYSLQQTTDGGYILAGSTYSSARKNDFWLVKTDQNGDQEWNRTFGGEAFDVAYSVKETTDGGYIIAGYTASFGAGSDDFWLVKTDLNGNKIWDKTFGGSGQDRARSVEQTSDGGYILVGEREFRKGGIPGYQDWDIYLVKTDSGGNQQWARNYDNMVPSEDAYSVEQTSDGGYIVVGHSVTYGYAESILIKTDSAGNRMWTHKLGTGSALALSASQTADGGYIAAGRKNADVWLVKIMGNQQWDKTFGGSNADSANCVHPTSDGGHIVAGYTHSFGSGNGDFWLIKTDSRGDEEWNMTIGGPARDVAYDVDETSDGGLAVTGLTMSYGKGNADFWLIKIARTRFRFPLLEELYRQFRLAVSDATFASLFNILQGIDVGDRMMADLTDEALQEIISIGFAKFFLDRINADLPPELKIRSIRQLPVDTQLEIEAISKVVSEVGTESILNRFFREIDFTERALVGFASASPLTLQLVSPEGVNRLYNQLVADFENSLREIEQEWLRLGQPIIDPSQAFFLLNTYRSDISRSTGRLGQLTFHASVATVGELGHVARVIQWFDSDIRQLVETALFALKIAAIFDVKAKVGTFIASLTKVGGLISVYNFLLQVIINENHLLRRSIVDIVATIIELLQNPNLYRLNPGTVLSSSFQEVTAIKNQQIGVVKYEYSWPIDSRVFVSAGFYSPTNELLFWTHSQFEFHSPGETAGYTLRYSFPGIIYALQFNEMVVRIYVHNVDASGERNFLLGPIITTIPVIIV